MILLLDLSSLLSPPFNKQIRLRYLISESWSAKQDEGGQKLENELKRQKEQTNTLVEKNEAVEKQLSEKGTYRSKHLIFSNMENLKFFSLPFPAQKNRPSRCTYYFLLM